MSKKKSLVADALWGIPGGILKTIFGKYPPKEVLDQMTPRERARREYFVREAKREYEREKQRKKDLRKGEGSTLSIDDS